MGNGQKLDTNEEKQVQVTDELLDVTPEGMEAELSVEKQESAASEKLSGNKEVIAYLAEKFPACFIADGEAKPLKIGIFQDLVERLKDDPKVSNTLLRSALRQYTNSWRYLHGVKPGAVRVDLDGSPCGELEQEHIDHAQQNLKESKERAFAKRKERQGEQAKEKRVHQPKKERTPRPEGQKVSRPRKSVKPASKNQNEKQNLTPVALSDVKEGAAVHVVLGASPVAGTVAKIEKDGVLVQLHSGMTVQVKPEHLVN